MNGHLQLIQQQKTIREVASYRLSRIKQSEDVGKQPHTSPTTPVRCPLLLRTRDIDRLSITADPSHRDTVTTDHYSLNDDVFTEESGPLWKS
ncbi:unnamed protein product [Heligmosomoides polygyrus]|uniref:Uncharacterized protein n=1 Tax=Heligmosomoides polygyrus TaxID=6339 RepID=A0A183F9H7_HELPZ|nr:unnamed protein product [Heligmosomoides polygyrus]